MAISKIGKQKLRSLAAAGLVALIAAGATACSSLDGLRFTNDHRLTLLEPTASSTVTLPFTVSWRVRDFTPVKIGLGDPAQQPAPTPDAGYFAIFVDRAPMPPGQDLKSLVSDDSSCVSRPDCPTPGYLAGRDIFITDQTSYSVQSIQSTSATASHELSVVLLDSHGRRIGDSSWFVSVNVKGS